MSEGLRQLWNLSQEAASTDGAEQFRAAFDKAIAVVNRNLQTTAANGAAADHRKMAAHRERLYTAYQQATSRFDQQDATAGQQAADKVLTAAETLGDKAVQAAESAAAARQQWLDREPAFDEIALTTGELEDGAHPKAPTLRKLVDAIQQRARGNQFSDCLAALDQLEPRFAEIVEQSHPAADPTHAMVEVHVAYQGTAVPGAAVRLTGPTAKPDATTDTAGVARFTGVEPGDYFVNAAKRAFVFQPARVGADKLCPGATAVASIAKAAQGSPAAPGYLYSKDGAPAPATPPRPGGTDPPATPPTPGGASPTPPGQPLPPGAPSAPTAGACSLQVLVVDEEGAPARGAMVRLSTGPSSPPDAPVNSSGIVTFLVKPGEYHVNAAQRDVVWQPAYVGPDRLAPGGSHHVTLSKPNRPEVGALTVGVRWKTGNAVEGATVTIDGNPDNSATTGKDGVAHFARLPVGKHTIEATVSDPEHGRAANLVAAEVTKGKNLSKSVTLTPDETDFLVSVFVRWKEASWFDDQNVDGAIVTLDPPVAPAEVAENGYASIYPVPAGEYSVSALIPDTAQTITVPGVVVGKGPRGDVTILASRSAAPGVADPEATGELYVTARRDGGPYPVSGATVTLTPPNVPPGVTREDGSVLFTDVPVGDYRVRVAATDDDGQQAVAEGGASVKANAQSEAGFVMPLPKGGIQATVLDQQTGVGVAGVQVVAKPIMCYGTTNAQGIALIPDLPPGEYVVAAQAPDWASPEHAAVVVANAIFPVLLTVAGAAAPPQSGSVSVTVSARDGRDLEFTIVTLLPTGAAQMAGTGHAQFDNVPFGDYTVEATLDDLLARQTVSVNPGVDAHQMIHLALG